MGEGGLVHLTDEQLAQLDNGDLPERLVRHFKACSDCAARLRNMQEATSAYVEYHSSHREPLTPPAPWQSLDSLILQHKSERRSRALRWLLAPALAASLATAGVIAMLYSPEQRSSRRASEILAQSAEVQLPEGRMISVAMQGRVLIRPAVLVTESGSESDAEFAQLQRMFSDAGYSWRDPLSPRSFQNWRHGLKKKRDSVTLVSQAGQRRYRVQTETNSGTLRTAALMLRLEDLHATQVQFGFQGQVPLEISETATPPKQADGTSPPIVAPRPSPPENRPVETPAGPEDVLHVLAALDAIGADVGEPVDVSLDRESRRVLVRAGGISAQRRQEIAGALRGLRRVTLDFQSSASATSSTSSSATEKFSSTIPAATRRYLEDRFGGAIALQEATDRVLESSASVVARTHALQVLATHFPVNVEDRLNGQDRELLHALVERHRSELRRLVGTIRTDLGPILPPSLKAPQISDAGSRIRWQDEVPFVARSAQETDSSLNRLLAGSYSQPAGDEMLRKLPSQIELLQQAIAQ